MADEMVASKLYGASPVELRPQLGLVPIGMNPKTKLWEFCHLRSAYDPCEGGDSVEIEIPGIDKAGWIAVGPETGIVFVLVLGGTFTMGAQRDDPKRANYDRDTEADETPRAVRLESYFLARHELAPGQWLCLSLQPNPSGYPAGLSVPPKAVTLAQPVESVDWAMCHDPLRAHDAQTGGPADRRSNQYSDDRGRRRSRASMTSFLSLRSRLRPRLSSA